jgi:flagellar basal body-associated protein FliL
MAKKNEQETAESGLELDRMNLSNIVSSGTQKPKPAEGEKTPSSPEKKLQDRKTSILILITSLSILALIMIVIIFFKQQDLSFTFLQGRTGNPLDNYLRVGPISATLANDDILNLSVDIDCMNDDLKQKLTNKDSLLRDKIVSVITSPDMDELLKKQRYDEIKARIREGIAEVSDEPVGDVYISDLLRY